MASAEPQISVERLRRLLAERAGPDPAALAEDSHDIALPVDVLDLEIGALASAHPGVVEEP